MSQLEITIPEDVEPGQILAIPIREDVNVQVRIPTGLGPGDVFYLCKESENSTEWTVAVPDTQEQSIARNTSPRLAQAQSLEPPASIHPAPLAPASIPAPALRPPAAAGVGNDVLVVLETSAGPIEIMVKSDWAPNGAERFLELVDAGHFEDLRIYRAVRGCLVQFGLPAKQVWPQIPDDQSIGVPFKRGVVCFAATGVSSRTGTVFVCLNDLSHCLGQSPWETPIGQVTDNSLATLDGVVDKYGDIAECGGTGPEATRARLEGNAYLDKHFPDLTRIFHAHCPHRLSPTQQANLATNGILPAAEELGAKTNGTPQAHFNVLAASGQQQAAESLQKEISPRMGGALDGDVVFNPPHMPVKSYSHQPPKLQSVSSPRTTPFWSTTCKNDVIDIPVELAQDPSPPGVIEVPVEIIKPGANMGKQLGIARCQMSSGDSARGSRGGTGVVAASKYHAFSTSSAAGPRRVLTSNSSALQASGATTMLSPVTGSRSPTRTVSRTISSMPQSQAARSTYGRSPGPAPRGQSLIAPATRNGYSAVQQSSVPVPPPHAAVLAMTQPIHSMQHAASFRR